MKEKFNKDAKVEQLAKVVLSHGEEKGLIVKDPSFINNHRLTVFSKIQKFDWLKPETK